MDSHHQVISPRRAHTKEARGFFINTIDSDDEQAPQALEFFMKAWDKIPNNEKPYYREVVGQCMDEKGQRCGKEFPLDINSMLPDKAQEECRKCNGEHSALAIASICKANLFPEPEGVTFYTENILWAQLEKKYKSYYINDIVRVYHQEGEDHLNTCLNTKNGKSLQQCRNGLWECWYVLSHYEIYKDYFSYPSFLIRYLLMRRMLKAHNDNFWKKYKLNRTKDKLLAIPLYLPIYLYSFIYKKKRMS